MNKKNIIAIGLALMLAVSAVGCTTEEVETEEATVDQTVENTEVDEQTPPEIGEVPQDGDRMPSDGAQMPTGGNPMAGGIAADTTPVEGSLLDTADMFTDRDLEQTADLDGAEYISLASGSDVNIVEEGVYVLSGQAEDVTVVVEVDDEAKVQIVLDGVSITNEDSPAIYVKSGDKVFVTTTDSDNYMEVSGTYEADGDTNLDAVVFSKSDLVLNGTGRLEVVSAEGNGITSKDDLKITGGEYAITSSLDGLEANDSIRIYDGYISIVTDKDALHSENDDDDALGYIYIQNGTLNITAADDAIRGTSAVQVDGGTINIETCTEGIEGTYVQINGGEIDIYSTDDGINAARKSTAYSVVIEVNDGDINVTMASGDTDGFDSNGSIYLNGGTINVNTSGSSYDADGTVELNGGTVMVNGEVVTEITQEQMGGKGKHGR
ncbi:protein of unknown function [Dethiosulfatibacter aminovorans DSM 17477]|uniref:Carbohydrate-binding domain-containing protein n=1 Tax=Dethiosulfatibacter aminovorans DSM 17477 TaxID=1121476 RepID=A0A1M6I943_9FIRM|nr:carbohydrate-binding domain-containing protein [Dethiosulfatibacter aminovorans]SHJ30990.1 protein of unknown function [Dethiosulfatibacter aminovorans DSM 17477]